MDVIGFSLMVVNSYLALPPMMLNCAEAAVETHTAKAERKIALKFIYFCVKLSILAKVLKILITLQS
jgi:hypothetical protein